MCTWENRRSDAKRKNYYSASAQQLTKALHTLPVFSGIYYKGDALYAYASGHSRGFTNQVWVDLAPAKAGGEECPFNDLERLGHYFGHQRLVRGLFV